MNSAETEEVRRRKYLSLARIKDKIFLLDGPKLSDDRLARLEAMSADELDQAADSVESTEKYRDAMLAFVAAFTASEQNRRDEEERYWDSIDDGGKVYVDY